MPLLKTRITFFTLERLWVPLLLILGAFLFGLGIGAFFIRFIDPLEQQELSAYLETFLKWVAMEPASLSIQDKLAGLFQTLEFHIIFLLLFWLFGLTIVGIPLIILLVGFKGFILGFTVGFLLQEKAGNGLFLVLSAILPQNLFYVPAFFIAALIAYYSSSNLLGSNRSNQFHVMNFFMYSIFYLFTFLLIFLGALIETFLVPGVVRIVLLFS